jgi:hypothetical protein
VIDVDEIVSRFRDREAKRSRVIARMAKVRAHYNDEVVVPLPDMDRTEAPAVANLLTQGVDQTARRIASTTPLLYCPPRDLDRKTEVKAAETRRRALLGWWEMNDLTEVKVMRRARHFVAYGSTPVSLGWDFKRSIPTWKIRDPLNTYPAPAQDPDCNTPDDVIFAYTRTRRWLASNYPEAHGPMFGFRKDNPDDAVTVLEFNDDTERVLVCVGDAPAGRPSVGGRPAYLLERIPNRAGICLGVVPGRVTLDHIQGQFDGMLGMYQMSARLMALEVIAAEKGVFPDLVLIGQGGSEPRLLDGEWYDGRTGRINRIVDGDFKEVQTAPGYQTNPTIDRLERAQRLTGGIPAEYGGESATNVRTGRRGDAVLSAAVDFTIQEAQRLLARSYQDENRRAIALAKAYAGNRSLSFYVNWKGASGSVTFTPNETFTTDENIVKYSYAGSDLSQLTIVVGQAMGTGLMSQDTARGILPLIDDPAHERAQLTREKLEDAVLSSLLEKAATGGIAPADVAWLEQQVSTQGKSVSEALIALDKRVSERQATPAPPGTPEAMAGLASGTPAEGQAAQPTIGPAQGSQGLASLLQSLRSPQRALPVERGVA